MSSNPSRRRGPGRPPKWARPDPNPRAEVEDDEDLQVLENADPAYYEEDDNDIDDVQQMDGRARRHPTENNSDSDELRGFDDNTSTSPQLARYEPPQSTQTPAGQLISRRNYNRDLDNTSTPSRIGSQQNRINLHRASVHRRSIGRASQLSQHRNSNQQYRVQNSAERRISYSSQEQNSPLPAEYELGSPESPEYIDKQDLEFLKVAILLIQAKVLASQPWPDRTTQDKLIEDSWAEALDWKWR